MMNISKHLLENLIQVSVFPKAFSVENISQILVLDDKLVSETVTVKTSMMGGSLLQSTGNEMYNLHPLVRQYCRTEKNVLEMDPDIGKSAQDKFNRHYSEKPKILSALSLRIQQWVPFHHLKMQGKHNVRTMAATVWRWKVALMKRQLPFM